MDETETREEDKNLRKQIGRMHFVPLYVGSFRRHAQVAYIYSMSERRVEQRRRVGFVAVAAVVG